MNAYAGNTEINRLERRIRELEAALSAANGRADFNDTRCAELEAEVEQLRAVVMDGCNLEWMKSIPLDVMIREEREVNRLEHEALLAQRDRLLAAAKAILEDARMIDNRIYSESLDELEAACEEKP